MKYKSVCLVLILGLLFLSGCGGSGRDLRVEYVTGVVTLDGEIVPSASITFVPLTEDGKTEAANGYSDEKGNYKLSSMNGDPERGAVEGEYKVLVTKIESESLKDADAPYYSSVSSGYNVNYKQTHLLPEIYRNRDKTPLTATVKRGKNKINLELKSTP